MTKVRERIRRARPVPPHIARELEALDAALAGEPVAHDFAAIGQMAQEMRDARPRPRAEFAERMDRWVVGDEVSGRADEAIPAAPPVSAPARLVKPRRRYLIPAGAAASLATVAAAVVVSTGVFVSRDSAEVASVVAPARSVDRRLDAMPSNRPVPQSTGSELSDDALPGVSKEAAPRAVPGGRRSGGPIGFGDRASAIGGARKVEQTVGLTLAAPGDQIERVADRVIAVTDRHGGYVRASQVFGGDAEQARAHLEISLPAAKLGDGLAELSKLAHVRSRVQNTQDVTARFNSTRRRLADARAERLGLLRSLARATSVNEVSSIRARLRLTNDRIAALAREHSRQRDQIDHVVLDIAIERDEAAQAGDRSTIGDAIERAGDVLAVSVGILIVALAITFPLAVLVALAWFAVRRSRRLVRERTLRG